MKARDYLDDLVRDTRLILDDRKEWSVKVWVGFFWQWLAVLSTEMIVRIPEKAVISLSC